MILNFLFALTLVQAQEAGTLPVDKTIQKSTEEIVLKKRSQALEMLAKALERDDLSIKQRKQLKEAFRVAAEIFFTDRGQSLYESGRNLYLMSSPEAIKKMQEALALEKENSLILWSLVKAHLKLSNCQRAGEEFEKLLAPLKEQKTRFLVLSAYCNKRPIPLSNMAALNLYERHFFKGVFLFWKGFPEEAQVALREAQKANKDFPETYYWLWKTDPQNIEAATKYHRLCETQKVSLTKKFEEFPQLCHFVSEVSGVEDDIS